MSSEGNLSAPLNVVNNTEALSLSSSIVPNITDKSNTTLIRTGNGTILADEIFLNTTLAQALSGIFVWSALLITCHQVSLRPPTPNCFFLSLYGSSLPGIHPSVGLE